MLFPYSNSDVAVSHYSDWSFSHWLFAGAVLLVSVLLTVIAVGLWTAAIPEDNIALYAGSAGVGALAVVMQAIGRPAVGWNRARTGRSCVPTPAELR
ncbi:MULTISPECIES: hypothetical protein [Rhodococcus]|jgi:hypothetical protein|uniref:hypothetical protein n=1 Tax=Rhodococcus TaxID=1827 RepID=UPI000EAA11A5|nr:hypothetical protein [Rhodococcus opacus]NHU47769.1 hypothetical protein [Rhodococcus sp. A14]RKM76540.1 hypothetical protein COO55_34110 [Rhodococcus opacus]UZG52836.1 hypothetical protein ONE62_22135 [Rhodococcus opacus]